MFQMELAQFEKAAGELIPEAARLVRGRLHGDAQRELWAVAAFKTLRLELMPHLECRVAELWPLLFLDRGSLRIDTALPAELGYSRVNRFFLVVDRSLGKCRFGPPHGTLALDRSWRGFGLGTYLFAQLIAWGKDHYPRCAITTEHFDLAPLDIERPVLNAFCQRAGFEIVFHAPQGVTCFAKRMELLQEGYDQQRVTEVASGVPADWFTPAFQGRRLVDEVAERWMERG
ncbi:hypothetical protein [Geoalkalibacter halelectricus]|uniref:N-acetyltransferase domain-containing protein n=1 Tax=Geoalkalibacter halelectricus TaxID=2847045 RepID=A0ABY5ZMX4_9BACT|nr:hypothetical protein [Geoalkalibacter halelectricus]MDO3378606.1 hypothetical protein [Geoalkalibacter halelectricus]UWZ80081.1 hypothetical protein L9S41_01490 [Geoalkalibacter halelectricus]